MADETSASAEELAEMTASIVSAYVANNAVGLSDLTKVIGQVHAALTSLGKPTAAEPAGKPAPPVSIKRSVTPDYLISLEDGRHYKSLKRHLSGRGLTPSEYRQKWSLPIDYPMTAPNYAARRSELAKSMGLGRKPQADAAKSAAPKGRRKSG